MTEVIFVFNSVHHTLKAEGMLKAKDLNFLVVPVPPFVNEGCGLGIKASKAMSEEILGFLVAQGITPLKVVEMGG